MIEINNYIDRDFLKFEHRKNSKQQLKMKNEKFLKMLLGISSL